jgi:hypothetical protein
MKSACDAPIFRVREETVVVLVSIVDRMRSIQQ